MLVFMLVMAVAFGSVGKALALCPNAPPRDRFNLWLLGAILFGHAVSFVSVSYFDQTVVFFYLSLAAIGSVYSVMASQAARQSRPVPSAVPPLSSEPSPSGV